LLVAAPGRGQQEGTGDGAEGVPQEGRDPVVDDSGGPGVARRNGGQHRRQIRRHEHRLQGQEIQRPHQRRHLSDSLFLVCSVYILFCKFLK
jgi:hypothetical protein